MYRFTVVALSLLALSTSASAQQQHPIELGLDGALAVTLDTPRSTSVVFPVQRVRAGFFVTPTISLEPALSLTHYGFSGGSSTDIDFVAAALFHLRESRASAQPYVRPFVEVVHSSFDGDIVNGSTNSSGVGAGVGVKIPVTTQFAWRVEAAYMRAESRNILSAYFGFSFFTH